MLALRVLVPLGILVWLELVQEQGHTLELEHSLELGRTLELVLGSQGRVHNPVLALGHSRVPAHIQALGLGQERTQVPEHSLALAQVLVHTQELERIQEQGHILGLGRSQVRVHIQAWVRILQGAWASSPCRRSWPRYRLFQHSCLCSECRPSP